DRVVRVSAEIGRQLHTRHEDLLCALLRFENGVIGLLHINWLSPIKVRELVVNGEGGMFVVDYLTQELTLYKNRPNGADWETLRLFTGVGEGDMIRYYVPRQEPLRLELEAFVRCVAHAQPFPVSGEDGLRALALALRLLSAAQA
ncbi:MAG: gfo/Idh/MocA family oxidoreductase, partial [Chloroflexota bacterium]